jgi:hypothetical protein
VCDSNVFINKNFLLFNFSKDCKALDSINCRLSNKICNLLYKISWFHQDL